MTKIDSEMAIAKTAEIVVAMLSHRPIDPAELPDLVRRVREALQGFGDLPAPAASLVRGPGLPSAEPARAAAVPISESVKRDYIISLEDGKPYRSLRRHLMAKYQMTPDDYRRKWGLPPDYPMVAPSYAEERSQVAKRTGLGRGARRTRHAKRKAD